MLRPLTFLCIPFSVKLIWIVIAQLFEPKTSQERMEHDEFVNRMA